MKKMLKDAADSGLLMLLAVAGIYCAAIFLAGCTSAPRAKDVNLRGMYANLASETVAIGSSKITVSSPTTPRIRRGSTAPSRPTRSTST